MVEQKFESFDWAGQMRYKCNQRWPNGTSCEYDTYDLDLMKDHVKEVHMIKRPVPPMPTLFDAEGQRVQREHQTDDDIRFAPERK